MNVTSSENHSSHSTFFLHTDEFGLFKIGGKDAFDYLHRQLSNEIKGLTTGEGVPTCYLNAQGRIRLFFNLWKSEEGYLAVLAGDQRNVFIEEMEKMVFREEIVFGDGNEEGSSLLIVGTDALAIVKELLEETPLPAENHFIETNGLRVFRVDWTVSPALHLFGPAREIEDLKELLESQGVAEGDWDRFHTLRIEKGTPWPGYEINDSMIPYECGLDNAVSLTKGCYVGQEVIARMANLGSPPRYLKGLRIDSDRNGVPAQGTPVKSGELVVGEVLTSGYSERLQTPLATSSIRKKFAKDETPLVVDGHPCQVVSFPV